MLTPDMFYSSKCKAIFACIKKMAEKNIDINITHLSNLPEMENYSPILVDISCDVICTIGWKDNARTILNDYHRRECIRFFGEMYEFAHKEDDLPEMKTRMEAFALQLHEQSEERSLKHISNLIPATTEKMDKFMVSGIFGLKTGIYMLDKYLHGLENGKLYIISARPGMGKTTFAMDIARNCEAKVAIFSLEMDSIELMERMISAYGGIKSEFLKEKESLKNNMKNVMETMSKMGDASIWVDDNPSQTPSKIMSECRVMKIKGGLDLIIIDYIQYMRPNGKARMSRYEAMTEISQDLKSMAKMLNVPVIAISSLRKRPPGSKNERPTLDDLKETGQIESDAHAVILIHQLDEEYGKEKKKAELILAKNRGGELRIIDVTFDGSRCRFQNYDPNESWGGGNGLREDQL
jgi:replicative DNA helicase